MKKRQADMHVEIGSYDAKTKFAEILRRVEAGEHFTITNRGKPVADLIPSRADSDHQVRSAVANILKARKTMMSDSDLKELISSGRK